MFIVAMGLLAITISWSNSLVFSGMTFGMLVVGFAAETTDVVGYAREKLKKKTLDLVIANDVTKPGAGFNTDTNIATILTRGIRWSIRS